MALDLPSWLDAAAVGTVVLAVLGWAGQQVWKQASDRKERKAQRLARLQHLEAILATGDQVFRLQNARVKGFLHHLGARVPAGPIGLNEGIVAAYPTFSAKKVGYHGVVRSMTEAMRDINAELSRWLEADRDFRTGAVGLSDGGKLQSELRELDLHLALWHAKHRYWMRDPRNTVVYLHDEYAHGVQFPRGLDASVQAGIRELGGAPPGLPKKATPTQGEEGDRQAFDAKVEIEMEGLE
jgi:hypothetical protein